jgi:hypothetical protein
MRNLPRRTRIRRDIPLRAVPQKIASCRDCRVLGCTSEEHMPTPAHLREQLRRTVRSTVRPATSRSSRLFLCDRASPTRLRSICRVDPLWKACYVALRMLFLGPHQRCVSNAEHGCEDDAQAIVMARRMNAKSGADVFELWKDERCVHMETRPAASQDRRSWT